MIKSKKGGHSEGYVFVLIVGLLTAGIIAAGAHYYRTYERNFRVEVECPLSGIAGLKADELVRYRQERSTYAALYQAKAGGRNRLAYAAPDD